MIVTRTVLLATFSALILTTPALARDRHKIDDAPCDTPGAFDGDQELVAYHIFGPDTFEDMRAKPGADAQAAPDTGADPDDGDPPDDPDADSDDDDDGSNNQGCAEIMVTPYDLMIHAPDRASLPVVLRRRVAVQWGSRA
jgi:hypothetical protein